jgi:hypothetical protein
MDVAIPNAVQPPTDQREGFLQRKRKASGVVIVGSVMIQLEPQATRSLWHVGVHAGECGVVLGGGWGGMTESYQGDDGSTVGYH